MSTDKPPGDSLGARVSDRLGGSQKRPHNIAGLLLAAGSGKRFGGRKLVDAKVKGQAIGLLAAQKFHNVLATYIVVRAEDKSTQSMFEAAGFSVIVAQHAALGMGHSLAAGMEVIKGLDVNACLVGLADMPLIRESTLRALCERLEQGADIARPRYCGRAGQPVGFGRKYFESLCEISGDTGARGFLRVHHDAVEYLDVEDEGIVIDVDTADDLSTLEGSP